MSAEVVIVKKAELEAKLQEMRDEVGTKDEEIATLQKELMEQEGVWRLAVRELLRPAPDLVREPLRAALDEAGALSASLGALSQLAESAGWQGEEPLAEWLEARLAGLEANGIAFGMDILEDVRDIAERYAYRADGPQKLADFLAEKLDHNSRIAHLHAEQVRGLEKKLVQEGQRITHLKLRLQEVRDLVAEALEI